jgi:ligand-binding sensor domain-containing protein
MRVGFFLLFIVFSSLAIAQDGGISILKKYVKNYSEEVYQKDPQNWSICEDNQGVLYFGNYNCILSFNGEKWLSIPTSNQSNYITALYYNPGDTMYWGGGGDFGYLVSKENGSWESLSLKSKLPEMDQYFSQVWRVFPYQNKIVFFTQESIFLFDPAQDSLQSLYPQNSFHLAFVVQNQLIVRDRSFGLMRFDGREFKNIPGGEAFLNDGVFAMLESMSDSILTLSQTLGYYYYLPKDDTILKHDIAENDFIVQQEVMGGFPLDNGDFALITASQGVFIISKRGKVKEQISLQSGISDNDVKWLHQDRYSNIWLATNNGISFVNYASDQSFYLNDEQSALLGSAKMIEAYQGKTYVGTTSGLFLYNGDEFRFEAVKGLEENLSALCSAPDALFVGTTSALYKLSDHQIERVMNVDVRSIDYSEQHHCLYVCGNNGIYILDGHANWSVKRSYPDLRVNVLKSLLLKQENSYDELWLGTYSDGLMHLKIAPNAKVEHKTYLDIDGTPGHYVMPFKIQGKPAFGMQTGVWEIYHDSTMTSSENDATVFFVPHSIPALEQSSVFNAIASPNGDLLIYNGNIARLDHDASINTKAFQGLNLGKINDIEILGNEKLWIASNQGITIMDISPKTEEYPKPDIHIDNIYLLPDSLLISRKTPASGLRVGYNFNSFRIDFSSIYTMNGFKAEYSYMLENYDADWSEWSSIPYVDYKQVFEGEYVFKVRSRNIYGVISQTKEIPLKIIPPWYRSLWAYFLYAIGLVLLVVAITRIYVYRLKQKNAQLEVIIKERTREIVEQKDEIEKQRDMITEAHHEIQSSIQYAQRIQAAVLPSEAMQQALIKDYFILFKPRDVVSGDFFWSHNLGDSLVITVADCTGHGVPGAFMSMLGVSLLNDIVGKEKVVEPAQILHQLRSSVIQSLKQDVEGDSNMVNDGMDISLVSINLKTGDLSWAGANNPLYILAKKRTTCAR